ncbi:GtrA family protein [Pleomorphochaeta sp. DL1XJH-081]|uniref:GtrA family protein n=1 Tax=Pleomorphochaeta sp. DL1XJH-081 TaxID=3409690 RepID=UPI003BB53AC2
MNLRLIKLSREIILYILFGFLTTVINIAIFWILYEKLEMQNIASNAIAWFCAVLFMFFSSKFIIFNSRDISGKYIIGELLVFLTARLFTGVLDIGLMYLSVDIYELEALYCKVITNIIVIILNFIASKFFVFKDKV